MTVKEYFESNTISEYVITDRNKLPIAKDIEKYMDFTDMHVTGTQDKNGVLYIYTDYIADSC